MDWLVRKPLQICVPAFPHWCSCPDHHHVDFLAQILVAANKWPRFPGCASSSKLSQKVTWWRKKAGDDGIASSHKINPAIGLSDAPELWSDFILEMWFEPGYGKMANQCSCISDPNLGTLKIETKLGNLSSHLLKRQRKGKTWPDPCG